MRYVVDVDYETQGVVTVEVEADDKEGAKEAARAKARSELEYTGMLGPRHTPWHIQTSVTSVEKA